MLRNHLIYFSPEVKVWEADVFPSVRHAFMNSPAALSILSDPGAIVTFCSRPLFCQRRIVVEESVSDQRSVKSIPFLFRVFRIFPVMAVVSVWLSIHIKKRL